jgi:hypothetical protein
MMNSPRGLLASLLFLFAFALNSNAAIISGSWDFSATSNSTTYSGTFSFTSLDTSLSYVDSTGAGFSVTTDFDTSGNGGNAFSYDPGSGFLFIGGLANSVMGLIFASASNDWLLSTQDFMAGQFLYRGSLISSGDVVSAAISPSQSPSLVPEPGSMALLAQTLFMIAIARTAFAPSRGC